MMVYILLKSSLLMIMEKNHQSQQKYLFVNNKICNFAFCL